MLDTYWFKVQHKHSHKAFLVVVISGSNQAADNAVWHQLPGNNKDDFAIEQVDENYIGMHGCSVSVVHDFIGLTRPLEYQLNPLAEKLVVTKEELRNKIWKELCNELANNVVSNRQEFWKLYRARCIISHCWEAE